MRYRLRTIMLAIVGSTAPIYATTAGYKAGCLLKVLVVWGVLVVLPLVLLALFFPFASDDKETREEVIDIFGTLAVLGYFFAIFISMIVIWMAAQWFR